jgi:hypothetical protein
MASAPPEALYDDSEDRMMQFVTFLQEEETNSRDEWLEDERANAIDFYNGEPFGDEEPGRSQIVTRDVAEVIDYMTVSLLRTMVSGDKVVELDCPEPPQEQQPQQEGRPPQPKGPTIAQQATAAVTKEFFQGQDGYRFLHDWIKAGLLEKSSVAKVCVEQRPAKRLEQIVSIEELAAMQEQGVNIVGGEPIDDGAMFRVAILQEQPPVFRDYVSPNEETGIAQDATDLDEDCAYLGFHRERTLSQIAALGFETEDLADEGGYAASSDILTSARDRNSGIYRGGDMNRSGANRKVMYHEEYTTYDMNGDGIAERILSHRVGNQILRYHDSGEYAIEVIDDQPGVVWCPFPMQHRIVGQSLADKVMDIQRTRSVLMRQGLDNLYQTNAPRFTVSENSIGDTTIDDLLTVRAGGIIRHLGEAPIPVVLPFAAQSAFEVMEVLNGEKESRTGITRLNQGLDADALNKTATGTALMQAQGQQIEEYLARNFAEGFARLMLKKYRLMRKYGRPMMLSIDGQEVQVDPHQWPEDMNVVVRVGLGSGRKDQRLQYRTMLLEIAQAAMQGGSRVFSDANIYNNIKGVIADANLGNIRELATDPDTLGDAPEKPDPEMLKVQAEAQIKAAEVDARKREAGLTLQIKEAESAAKIAIMREEAAAKLDLEQAKAEAEQALALRQQDFEMAMAREQMTIQREQAAHKATLDEQQAVSKKRPGGDLDK